MSICIDHCWLSSNRFSFWFRPRREQICAQHKRRPIWPSKVEIEKLQSTIEHKINRNKNHPSVSYCLRWWLLLAEIQVHVIWVVGMIKCVVVLSLSGCRRNDLDNRQDNDKIEWKSSSKSERKQLALLVCAQIKSKRNENVSMACGKTNDIEWNSSLVRMFYARPNYADQMAINWTNERV